MDIEDKSCDILRALGVSPDQVTGFSLEFAPGSAKLTVTRYINHKDIEEVRKLLMGAQLVAPKSSA
jgi:hypothetical protein